MEIISNVISNFIRDVLLDVISETIINVISNDEYSKKDGAKITQLNGKPIEPGGEIKLPEGRLALTPKGSVFFEPATGLRMARL